MSTRLLDFDPLTKEAVWFTDNHDGSFSLTQTQDVEDILDGNKRLANEIDKKKGIDQNWWHYATIPNILIAKWSKEIGGDILAKENEKELFKRVNHPDYKYLKTTDGRHGAKA